MRASAYYRHNLTACQESIYDIIITDALDDNVELARFVTSIKPNTDNSVFTVTVSAKDKSEPHNEYLPLVVDRVRTIIRDFFADTRLSTMVTDEYLVTRKPGGYLTASTPTGIRLTINTKPGWFKLVPGKDVLGDVRIWDIINMEICSPTTVEMASSEEINKNMDLFRECAYNYIVGRCIYEGHPYFRPKQYLTHGIKGLDSLSISELEMELRLWFGSVGMEDVTILFRRKVRELQGC